MNRTVHVDAFDKMDEEEKSVKELRTTSFPGCTSICEATMMFSTDECKNICPQKFEGGWLEAEEVEEVCTFCGKDKARIFHGKEGHVNTCFECFILGKVEGMDPCGCGG